MLIDQAKIFVRSGKGGDGCVSLRREKYIPKGGPDGGDGGDGGDVILVGDPSLSTLLPLTPRPHYRAGTGEQGRGKSMHGADGDDKIVKVPVGTEVYDAETKELIVDIDRAGQTYVIAPGGKGGLGNEHFKSATNQTPRIATPGEPFVERTLILELKLIADIGLVGKPNAGKSTFLSAVSRARPKVADYPFTTLSPQLGIADLGQERRLIVADIPGLIEGAADGAGLGHEFLRHIERTQVLVHLLDLCPIDGTDPIANYHAIREELEAYSPILATKAEIVVLNKVDLLESSERPSAETAKEEFGDRVVVFCSGATGEGVKEVLEACWRALQNEEPGWTARPAETPK